MCDALVDRVRAYVAGLLKISEEEDEGGGRDGGSKAEQGKVFPPPPHPLKSLI